MAQYFIGWDYSHDTVRRHFARRLYDEPNWRLALTPPRTNRHTYGKWFGSRNNISEINPSCDPNHLGILIGTESLAPAYLPATGSERMHDSVSLQTIILWN